MNKITIAIIIGVLLIVAGGIWYFDKRDTKVEMPIIKNFTICQGSFCVDTDTLNISQQLGSCLDTDSKQAFCGAFVIKYNK